MEGMRGIRRRHDPFVVWLVERLVHHGMMQTAMDPVDEEVGEEEEERELDEVVQRERGFRGEFVELRVPAYFSHEEGRGEDGHGRH